MLGYTYIQVRSLKVFKKKLHWKYGLTTNFGLFLSYKFRGKIQICLWIY